MKNHTTLLEMVVPEEHLTCITLDDIPAQMRARTEELPPEAGEEKKTVVCISSTNSVIISCQEFLHPHYNVASYFYYSHAFDHLMNNPYYQVDAFVLDLQAGDMTRGEMDTLNFLARMRDTAWFSQTPVLLLATLPAQQMPHELQPDIERTNGVLVKPFTTTMLLGAVKRILNLDPEHPFCDLTDLQPFTQGRDEQLYQRNDSPRPYWTGARVGYGVCNYHMQGEED